MAANSRHTRIARGRANLPGVKNSNPFKKHNPLGRGFWSGLKSSRAGTFVREIDAFPFARSHFVL
jgi:hypothetical protein